MSSGNGGIYREEENEGSGILYFLVVERVARNARSHEIIILIG